MKVFVGTGVFVRVAVGGIGVVVGMAAWVSARIVRAAATAVPCKSTGLIVGVAFGTTRTLQALMISVITRACVRIEKFFKWRSPADLNYTSRITS